MMTMMTMKHCCPNGDDYARAQAAMSRMMSDLPIEGKRSTCRKEGTPDLALLKSPQQLALEQNMLGEKGVDTQVLNFLKMNRTKSTGRHGLEVVLKTLYSSGT